ncbi:MAG: carboxypeptidase-like regulatory domain-containing protein, partial [Thermodesulfobacteriota bacterium]
MTLRQLKIFLNIFIIILLSTSCSDNYSDTYEDNSETTVISGIITDPPVKNARVLAIDQKTLEPFPFNESSATTDASGKFSLIVKESDLGNTSHIESYGGIDTKTGVSFKGLSFKAYFKNDKKSNMVVSPLTTIIYHMVSSSKMSFEQAEAKTASAFDLDPGTSPSADPLSNKKLLIANMITAHTAVSVNKETPFKLTAEILSSSNKFIQNSNVDKEILNQITDSSEISDNIQNHYQKISAAGSTEEIIKASKAFMVKSFFFDSLKPLIKDDYSDFEANSELIKSNLKFITDKISDKNIPLETNTVANILRYILNEYNLAEISLNSSDQYEFKGVFFEQNLQESDLYNSDNIFISQDKALENLISASTYFRHDNSVLPGEIPGNDNAKRIDYYFNSDISHLYLASKTLNSVYDDKQRDYIQTQIVKGYASAGLFDKAELIADT